MTIKLVTFLPKNKIKCYYYLYLNIHLINIFATLLNILDDLIGTKKLIQNILVTSPKPSFLFWDKVYSKLNAQDEGFWFIRALEGILLDNNEALLQNNDAQ